MNTLNIKVIIGSTRNKRFGERPARWIFEQLKKKDGVEAELLDLRDYAMPFFEEAETPSYKKQDYTNESVVRWTKKIAEADGFIIVSPEYNHGYPAVLKNAMDYVYKEWNNKAVGFVSYGSVGGGRVVEQLRLVSIELQMAPIRTAVHIPWETMYKAITDEKIADAELLKPFEAPAENFLTQLLWWTTALKAARQTIK
jgi:NAD(P)H-dependent FMN reductase